jgi:hypothetical protein
MPAKPTVLKALPGLCEVREVTLSALPFVCPSLPSPYRPIPFVAGAKNCTVSADVNLWVCTRNHQNEHEMLAEMGDWDVHITDLLDENAPAQQGVPEVNVGEVSCSLCPLSHFILPCTPPTLTLTAYANAAGVKYGRLVQGRR